MYRNKGDAGNNFIGTKNVTLHSPVLLTVDSNNTHRTTQPPT